MSKVPVTDSSSNLVTVLLDGDAGDVIAGGNGQGGRLSLYPKAANATIPATAIFDLRSGDGHARIGGGFYQATGTVTGPPVIGVDGTLTVQDKNGNSTLLGSSGALLLSEQSGSSGLGPGAGNCNRRQRC